MNVYLQKLLESLGEIPHDYHVRRKKEKKEKEDAYYIGEKVILTNRSYRDKDKYYAEVLVVDKEVGVEDGWRKDYFGIVLSTSTEKSKEMVGHLVCFAEDAWRGMEPAKCKKFWEDE